MKQPIRGVGVRPVVRGRVAVDLIDDWGRRVHHVEQPNMVSENWLGVLEKLLGFQLFETRALNSAQPSNTNSSGFDYLPNFGIVLTDCAATASQADRVVKGTKLGWASTSYLSTGSGSRGSYNSGDSIAGPFYQKLVFDFATNQANGTFQSVYAGPFAAVADTTSPAIASATQRQLRTVTFANSGDMRGTVRGYAATDLIVQMLGGSGASSSLRTNTLSGLLSGTAWETVALPVSAVAIDFRGARLYWLAAVSGSGTARTQSVYSAPVSDLATYRTEKTFDNAALTAFGATLGELAWSAARGRWLIGPGASGAAAGLWEFDDAWTLIQSLLPAAAVGSGYGAGLSAYPTDPDGIAAGTGIWDITSQTAMTLSTGSPGYRCYPIGEQLTLLVPASGTGGYLAAQSTFFSRAVLDAPVTKTATNTMKISYEFTTDQPALW